jgi:hypothetical protein
VSSDNLPARTVPDRPHYAIDHDAVLKAVGINARDPNAQALLLTCERYGLDPILKHMILIQGRPYVTRDGLLHVAHRSGQFDGIEVVEQGETQTHHTAKVSVYRKDMGRPFTYIGRYPKNGSNKGYGPEMAVKCGEVMALRRAFNVGLCAREEVWDQEIADEAPSPSRRPNRQRAALPPPIDIEREAEDEPAPDRQAINAGFTPRETQQVYEAPDDDERPDWPGFAARRAKSHNDALEGLYEESGVDPSARHHHKVNAHQLAQVVAGKAVERGLPDPAKRTQGWASGVADRLWRSKAEQVRAVVEEYLAGKRSEARKAFGLLDDGPEDEAQAEPAAVGAGREAGSDDDVE